jgi:hypothetical protein
LVDFAAAGPALSEPSLFAFELAAYSPSELLWLSETLLSTALRVSKESHSGLALQPLRRTRQGKLQTISGKFGIKYASAKMVS